MKTPNSQELAAKHELLDKIEATLAEKFPNGPDSPGYAEAAEKLLNKAFGDVVNLSKPENYAPHLEKLISDIYKKEFDSDERGDLKRLKKLRASGISPEEFVKIAEPMYNSLQDAIENRDKNMIDFLEKYDSSPKGASAITGKGLIEMFPGIDYRYKMYQPITPDLEGSENDWVNHVLRDLDYRDEKTDLPVNISKIAALNGVTFDDAVTAALNSTDALSDEPPADNDSAAAVPEMEVKEEIKEESEPEKVAVPVKRSATESKCTRVRRRSDADDLPDDTGGLTEKDLKEPKIHDDAEGSSVKHMGDPEIRKSISELMRERMARR